MQTFNVYPRYEIEPVKGKGCYVWDKENKKYLDLYGGHAVISIGHSHPKYVQAIRDQVEKLGFYSNSVRIPLQEMLAQKLGDLAGLPEYSLFLTNSGAESTENALKLASFHTKRKKVIVFEKGFHGRTSLAVEATDSTKIAAPVNITGNIIRLPLNDLEILEDTMNDLIAAIMVEGIQGVGGIHIPSQEFLTKVRQLCDRYGAVLILDEIQSGYGRSGKFFAHQHNDVKPDIISMAKGMGNGFPIGGILIAPQFEVKAGLLGTTFGGNHLACAAGNAVLDVIKEESLIENAKMVGTYFIEKLREMDVLKEVRGRGLMIGIDLKENIKPLRSKLLLKHHIFTGSSSNPHTLRILPPLNITTDQVDYFIHSLKKVI
ncbi:MAG: aminotransferase class III-fold pyridoxal phosphate-dependent enzyme [Ekhidna sp.]|nr:aminotransferase class III-fold pyridoxal phosphate-dependent enzyme [Ekhidna sp.]MBC6408889.1 aminotransferase class III-fold pyridoxal phosphate-dependent enzyme [Ekhidna sp.]